jgi:hypothetical protein
MKKNKYIKNISNFYNIFFYRFEIIGSNDIIHDSNIHKFRYLNYKEYGFELRKINGKK